MVALTTSKSKQRVGFSLFSARRHKSPPSPRCSFGEIKKSRDASSCLGATQVSVRLAPVQDSFDSSTRLMGVACQNSSLPCAITTFFLRDSNQVFERTVSPVETLAAKRILRRPSVAVSFTPQPPTPLLHNPPLSQTPGRRSVRNRSSPHCTLMFSEKYCNLMNAHTTSTLPYVLHFSQYVLKTMPYCRIYVRIPILLVRV